MAKKNKIKKLPLLYAPKEYWELTPEQKADICNGCGTKGIIGWFVPDNLLGLNISEACNIHDFMYAVGETIEDKDYADRVFLNNMLRLIEANRGCKWLKRRRAKEAKFYYLAVHDFGGPAFWNGKNNPGKLGTPQHKEKAL